MADKKGKGQKAKLRTALRAGNLNWIPAPRLRGGRLCAGMTLLRTLNFFNRQSSIVNREPARRGIKCGVWKRLSPVVPFAAPVAVVSAARGKTEGILLGHTTSADVMKAKFQRYSDESVGYAAVVY